MIDRLAESLVHELAKQFPAILILGPRQCGKTTLAKYSLKGEYFDLEKPSDQQVFINDPEFALRRLDAMSSNFIFSLLIFLKSLSNFFV